MIFDCGATNLRVVAMTTDGRIKASKSFPNATADDPFHKGGKIWPLEAIWDKLCAASKIVAAQLENTEILGVSVTTFGVDGAFLDTNGKLAYPVISWQCDRTHAIIRDIDKYISLKELYRRTGVYPYGFNTINKLIWLNENKPEITGDKTNHFLFMPSLLIHLLSGVRINDSTMLGTSMLCEIGSQKPSSHVLDKIGISEDTFPPFGYPGDVVGKITDKASQETGIPKGVSVCLSGHDTQFAVLGSGAGLHEPILSSGTWEILMSRSDGYSSGNQQFDLGITTEFDTIKGWYNIGVNYLASGLLEWIGEMFYHNIPKEDRYDIMMQEAAQIAPGANRVVVNPKFYSPADGSNGVISGLTLSTTRGEIYRACLEALALRLKSALRSLESAAGFRAKKIICVGGGSKNMLWNQIKADICDIPIQLISQKETTVLGSAICTFTGVGYYKNLEEAQSAID